MTAKRAILNDNLKKDLSPSKLAVNKDTRDKCCNNYSQVIEKQKFLNLLKTHA